MPVTTPKRIRTDVFQVTFMVERYDDGSLQLVIDPGDSWTHGYIHVEDRTDYSPAPEADEAAHALDDWLARGGMDGSIKHALRGPRRPAPKGRDELLAHLLDVDGHRALGHGPTTHPAELTDDELHRWHKADHVPEEGVGPRDGHTHPEDGQ